MLIGRSHEYAYLNEYLKRPGSQLVVFYGQKFLGKTAFLLDYCNERPFSYYLAVSGSEKQNLDALEKEAEKLKDISAEEKKIFIIDEFHLLAKSPEFMPFCFKLMEEEQVLILLVSSAINWVESSMVRALGKSAVRISGFYKCREISFGNLCKIYPDYPRESLFALYCILGGIPGLWRFMDMEKSLEENLTGNILSDKAYLYHAGYGYCLDGLRERGVYDTILSAMAKGCTKLNDLYHETGYSRAKISVYLKALMEQGQIEKVYSIECPGMENARKGIYEINSHFTSFWFTFIHSDQSQLQMMTPEEFLKYVVGNRLGEYCSNYIHKVVREYLLLTGIMESVPKGGASRFIGKKRNIDLVWKRKEGGYGMVWCRRLKAMVTYEDYEELLSAAKEAGIRDGEYYMVSYGSFDEKITLEARIKPNLHLLTLKDVLAGF